MSDERSSPSTATDDPDAADGADETAADGGSSDSHEPGGGPQRVVSEQSVDDILESLDATKSGAADSAEATTETSDAVTTTFDEDDVPEPDEMADDADGSATTETAERTTADEGAETNAAADTAATASDGANATDAATVDAAASSLPDDASLEDLAARVESGSVTGADVRAAEAGEGRESTPEIDDVDLSMDDLETAGTEAGEPGETDWPDDAGPLAGSVDRDAADGTSDETEDDVGFLGRLKRFFTR